MRIIATNKVPAAIGPYSQGYVVNGLLFTSGQIALIPDSGVIALSFFSACAFFTAASS